MDYTNVYAPEWVDPDGVKRKFFLWNHPGKRDDPLETWFSNQKAVTGLKAYEEAVEWQYCPVRLDGGYRNDDNFLDADVLVLDVDNTHSDNRDDWITLDQLKEIFKGIPFYFETSRNHLKEKTSIKTVRDKDGKRIRYTFIHQPRPKYHVLFPLLRDVKKAEEYKAMKKHMAFLFPNVFDTQDMPATQMKFVGEAPERGFVDGSINLDEWLKDKPKPEEISKTASKGIVNTEAGLSCKYDFQWYEHCLSCIDVESTDHESWTKIGMALKYESQKKDFEDRAFQLFDQWSSNDYRTDQKGKDQYKGTDGTYKVWQSFKRTDENGRIVTGASLTDMAKKAVGVDRFFSTLPKAERVQKAESIPIKNPVQSVQTEKKDKLRYSEVAPDRAESVPTDFDIASLKQTIDYFVLQETPYIPLWDGMTTDEALIWSGIHTNAQKREKLIKRWITDNQRITKNAEKYAKSDLRTLLFFSKKTNKPIEDRIPIVLSMYKRSKFWQTLKALETPNPEEPEKINALVWLEEIAGTMETDRSGLPTFKDENGQFLLEECAKTLIEKTKPVIDRESDDVYFYVDGVYTSNEKSVDRYMIRNVLSNSREGNRKEVRKTVSGLVDIKEEAPANFISFANGVLNIQTGQMMEHDPDLFIKNMVPWDYDPEAHQVEAVETALDQWSCGDPVIRETLLELMGLCFYRSYRFQYIFFLTGRKSNGKSLYLNVLSKILGDHNCSAVPTSEIGKDFQIASLYGKLANLSAENEAEYIAETEKLKKLIGDLIHANRKHLDPITFRNKATAVFSFNELPRFKDPDGALKRRIVPIPFNATFTSEQAVFDYPESYPDKVTKPDHVYMIDPFAFEKLTTDEAIAYWIRLGIEGLNRALSRGSMRMTEQAINELDEIDALNHQEVSFAQDMANENETTDVGYLLSDNLGNLYNDYQAWAWENGIKNKLAKKTFSTRLQARYNLKTVPDYVYVQESDGQKKIKRTKFAQK